MYHSFLIHSSADTYFYIYLLKTMSSHWKFQSNSARCTLFYLYFDSLLRSLASILLNYLISPLMLPSFQFHLPLSYVYSLFWHPSHTQTSFFSPLLSSNTICQTTLCMDALFIPLGIYTESILSYLVFITYTELSISIDTLLTLLVLWPCSTHLYSLSKWTSSSPFLKMPSKFCVIPL